MRPSTGIILPLFLFDKTLDSAASIEWYSIDASEQVCLNRSTKRKGMQNVLVVERWGEGAAGAKGARSRLLHEKE
jgi:hypothetical protein